jgi:hydroxymethylbilane synthase
MLSTTQRAVCATRRSPLAMMQSHAVAERLAGRGIATTMLGVTTTADRDARPIERMDSVNVFVSELERALREKRADYAVHSCKDLPSSLAQDMHLAAIGAREDARDAFCSERFTTFASLPAGSIVGTSSPRRRAQMEAVRPDLRYESVRGNVETRLRKVRDGEYAAIVLAMAGLRRLKTGATYVVPFSPDEMVPAVGQGAIAVETRAGDETLSTDIAEAFDDATARLCVECERSALAAMHAGCSAPIGIYAELDGDMMNVRGFAQREATAVVRARLERNVTSLDEARALGRAMASELSR